MIVNKLSLIVVSYHVADKMVRCNSPMKAHFTQSILSSGSGFGFPAVHIKPLCV